MVIPLEQLTHTGLNPSGDQHYCLRENRVSDLSYYFALPVFAFHFVISNFLQIKENRANIS